MRINAPVILLQKPLPHSSIFSDMVFCCIRKFEVGNQIVPFSMICNFHIQPPFFVLNCLQIRIKELSPSPFTTTSASIHSPQMSQPHMLYFSRCAFPLKYYVCQKCLHLHFTTYHIVLVSVGRINMTVAHLKGIQNRPLCLLSFRHHIYAHDKLRDFCPIV